MNAAADELLRVQLVTTRSQIPLSAEQWNLLVDGNETNTVFQTYEWFDSWWQAFGDNHELFFLAVYKGPRIVGFAPLMLTPAGRTARRLEFVGTGNADYLDFVVEPAEKRLAVGAMCAFLSGSTAAWTKALLSNIPRSSSTVACLRDAGALSGLHLLREAEVACPALVLEGRKDEVNQRINKYGMRRRLNWFKKRGSLSFENVATVSELELLLPRFFDQHIRRWAATGRSSQFKDHRQQKFYALLGRALHARGWLVFSVVRFAQEPIAFHFGFDYGGTVTWYKPCFEVSYAERSPGLVLIHQLVEDTLRRTRREIDFTIGDEAFKRRFANTYRSNLYLGLYRSRPMWLAAVAERTLRRILGRSLRTLTMIRGRHDE
jgi:CelD/BcsL family acetyltransferase involved in cellulose biosynthesis